MSEKIWRILPGLVIETASWDQQLVLYHSLSGDTHLLNRPVDWILDQLALNPCTLQQLVERAITADIAGPDDPNAELFTNLLESLERIDLLEADSR